MTFTSHDANTSTRDNNISPCSTFSNSFVSAHSKTYEKSSTSSSLNLSSDSESEIDVLSLGPEENPEKNHEDNTEAKHTDHVTSSSLRSKHDQKVIAEADSTTNNESNIELTERQSPKMVRPSPKRRLFTDDIHKEVFQWDRQSDLDNTAYQLQLTDDRNGNKSSDKQALGRFTGVKDRFLLDIEDNDDNRHNSNDTHGQMMVDDVKNPNGTDIENDSTAGSSWMLTNQSEFGHFDNDVMNNLSGEKKIFFNLNHLIL